jgi:hypothetical protein
MQTEVHSFLCQSEQSTDCVFSIRQGAKITQKSLLDAAKSFTTSELVFFERSGLVILGDCPLHT